MSDTSSSAIRGVHLIPVIMFLSASVVLLWGFLFYVGLSERSALIAQIAAQEQPLQQAALLRIQLDGLASAAAKLAEAGDVGAKQVVASMNGQGFRPVETLGMWHWSAPAADSQKPH
jgi:hypothetical protein